MPFVLTCTWYGVDGRNPTSQSPPPLPGILTLNQNRKPWGANINTRTLAPAPPPLLAPARLTTPNAFTISHALLSRKWGPSFRILQVHRLSDKPTTCAVTIVIFSEGKTGMTGLDILDEHHKIVTWDIAGDSCEELGLHCHQVT